MPITFADNNHDVDDEDNVDEDHSSLFTQEPFPTSDNGSCTRSSNTPTDSNSRIITTQQHEQQEPSNEERRPEASTTTTKIRESTFQPNENIHNMNADDDDDWSTSCGTSDDPCSEMYNAVSSQKKKKPDLAERRARNIQRNQEFLHALHLRRRDEIGNPNESIHDDIHESKTTSHDQPTKVKREKTYGDCNSIMMAKMPYILQRIQHEQGSSVPSISLVQKYPHRQEQIRKLSSYLLLTRQTAQLMTHARQLPPIFITGPPGTGKTSIVRDLLIRQQQEQDPQKNFFISHAYVDCQTLDGPENFTHVAYRLFYQNYKAEMDRRKLPYTTGNMKQSPFNQKSHSMRKRKERSFQKEYQSTPSTGSSSLTDMADLGRRLHRLFTNVQQRRRQHGGIVMSAAILVVDHAEALLLSSSQGSTTTTTNNNPINRLAQLLLLPRTTFGDPFPLTIVVITNSVLLEYTGAYLGYTAAAVLLLDYFSHGKPFSSSCLHVFSWILVAGLNHLASQWTIAGHIVPLRIHFPAYHGKRTLKEVRKAVLRSSGPIVRVLKISPTHSHLTQILCQERLRKLITGEQNTDLLLNHPAAGFYDAVYASFLETLVQAMCDLTTDIREYLRIGRSLWPAYVLPCSPTNIHTTLERARKQAACGNGKSIASVANEDPHVLKREILLLLDQNIFPRVRNALEHGIGSLEWDSPGTIDETNPQSISPTAENGHVPAFADYLLLAAYVCQVNRPDTDKQIFSIQKNGRKRRRGNANNDQSAGGTGEDVAFGFSFTDQNTHRARSFPLERLYSLYVNMINLNYCKNSEPENGEDALRSLGTIEFDASVAFLIDVGVLHEYPSRSSTETIRLSQRSVWSSITKSEAQDAAKRVNFPLDRYTQ